MWMEETPDVEELRLSIARVESRRTSDDSSANHDCRLPSGIKLARHCLCP